MDPRLRFFEFNNWSWELNITTTNLMAYLNHPGTPQDALLAKNLIHYHNQCIFKQFVNHNQENSLVGKIVLYLFILLC